MNVSISTRNSLVFLGFLSTTTSLVWLLTTIPVYWNSPHQAIGLYECRWLLSSLAVASFFVYLFITSASLVIFTAAYASAQYTLTYSLVSLAFNNVNFFQIFSEWSNKDRREALDYIRLNAFLTFLSFISMTIMHRMLKILIEIARNTEQNMESFERKYCIMFCSVLQLVLGLVSFAICLEMNANASYSASFIVQQVCCASISLSVAYMQWYFRNACNTHILRVIVVMNVCQFVQEITYTYSTYMLIMTAGRKSDITPSKFDAFAKPEASYLLIGTLVIHSLRLITYVYPVTVFSKKAFLAEILCRIRFFANRQRGISAAQAKHDDNADKQESRLLFYCGLIVSTACIATDITYYVWSNARRVGHTGVSLIYTICLVLIYYHYRKERRIMFLKLLAVLSIIILNSSIHTIYVFGEAMFTGRLYLIANRSAENIVINSSYFLLSLCLILLSAKSTIFCFRTITKHTPLYTQPTSIMVPLRWLTILAYVILAIIITEILFTAIMYKLYSTRIDFILANELFLWINSISTCLLQIFVSKHERFQRCVIILIVQLLSDCSTTMLLILAQSGIVQAVLAVMTRTRHHKALLHTNTRIFYIVVDHLLQVIQWALGICSLGLALVVLDGVETEEDDFSVAAHNPAVEDEGFFGRSMRELLHSPEISELLITERNPTTDRSSCSIYGKSADIDCTWGESHVSFDEETDEGSKSDCKISKEDGRENEIDERSSSNNNATESDVPEEGVQWNDSNALSDNDNEVNSDNDDDDDDDGTYSDNNDFFE